MLITEYVEFISPAKWDAERASAMHLLERWRKDVESADAARLMAHYSRQFRSAAQEDLQTWLGKQARFTPSAGKISVELKDPSQFLYPGRDDLMVSTFTEVTRTGKQSRSLHKRQYWLKEGPYWKIIFEGYL